MRSRVAAKVGDYAGSTQANIYNYEFIMCGWEG